MSENSIVLHIEIGIIKDLFKSALITESQRDRAIKILQDKYNKENNTAEEGVVKN